MSRSARQRAASRRNIARARAVRRATLFGTAGRIALSFTSSKLSGGTAKPISNFIEGKGNRKKKKNARGSLKKISGYVR